MNFVRENYKALLLILFAILSETIIVPFSTIHSVVDGYSYTYGEALYYFLNQLGYVSFFPSIFLYISEKNINSRGLYLVLIIWNFFELLQEINFLFKLKISWLNKIQSYTSDIYQIIYIIMLVTLVFLAYKKLRT